MDGLWHFSHITVIWLQEVPENPEILYVLALVCSVQDIKDIKQNYFSKVNPTHLTCSIYASTFSSPLCHVEFTKHPRNIEENNPVEVGIRNRETHQWAKGVQFPSVGASIAFLERRYIGRRLKRPHFHPAHVKLLQYIRLDVLLRVTVTMTTCEHQWQISTI